MHIKIKVVLSALVLSLLISEVQAGPIAFVKKHPILTTAAVGAGIYLGSIPHKAKKLAHNPSEVEPYFQQNPQDFNPIAKHVLSILEHIKGPTEYDRYHKLAEIMGLPNLPPSVRTTNNQPTTLTNPQQHRNPNDDRYENPIVQLGAGSNIIYTPEGKQIDTGTEFPNQPIASWEDYIYAKTQSEILAENMRNAGMGPKPKGYAAHHIVAWDDNKSPRCQQLRDLLNRNGIALNDAENGVYLPARIVTRNSNEAYHPEIHTKDYYEKVYKMLRPNDGNTQDVKNELQRIAQLLKTNQF